MAGKPEERPMRPSRDSNGEPRGEPREREKMSLIDNGGSVSVTIPVFAVKLCGYEVGQKRPVEVYDDGVWIPKEVPDE